MQVSASEGLANHTVPESCADVREGIGEALTGVGRNFKGRLKRHGRIVNLADPERLFPARSA